MTSFLNDSEVQQIWSIVGKACDRENIDTTGDQELSVRVYDEIELPDDEEEKNYYESLSEGKDSWPMFQYMIYQRVQYSYLDS